jgi:hypothetical protein
MHNSDDEGNKLFLQPSLFSKDAADIPRPLEPSKSFTDFDIKEFYSSTESLVFASQSLTNLKGTTDPREKKRQDVLRELINTERDFLTDMRILRDLYMIPCMDSRLLSRKRSLSIFLNIDEIIDSSTMVDEKLRGPNTIQTVIELFQNSVYNLISVTYAPLSHNLGTIGL